MCLGSLYCPLRQVTTERGYLIRGTLTNAGRAGRLPRLFANGDGLVLKCPCSSACRKLLGVEGLDVGRYFLSRLLMSLSMSVRYFCKAQ
jgi:hypothetical protein